MSILGTYVSGCGRAHLHTADLWPYFNCPVFGTFNVQTESDIRAFKPCIADEENGRWFWLVRLNGHHYAWAYRWAASRQAGTTWELVSKALLPEYLKAKPFVVEVMERMTDAEITEWAAKQYWFQSFPWGPQRSDTALVWNTMRPLAQWQGKTVLDIGCNAGAYSFLASKCGARCVGYDKDVRPLATAMTINDHIEMQDVRFVDAGPCETFDTILYLSVHHQWDKEYRLLKRTLLDLCARARQCVFVELIVSDLPRGLTVDDISKIAGVPILSYRHKVRGIRQVYKLEGTAKC